MSGKNAAFTNMASEDSVSTALLDLHLQFVSVAGSSHSHEFANASTFDWRTWILIQHVLLVISVVALLM